MSITSRWVFTAFLCTAFCVTVYANDSDKVWECGKNPDRVSTGSKQLQLAQVLELAHSSAENRGLNFRQYRLERTCFDKKRREWTIYFEGLSMAVGNHFWVVVNDKTKVAELVLGM